MDTVIDFDSDKVLYDKRFNGCLREEDFYPPADTRLYESGVCDVEGGDDYEDYAKWFWEQYEYEIYDLQCR